jgi:hypothetical protein
MKQVIRIGLLLTTIPPKIEELLEDLELTEENIKLSSGNDRKDLLLLMLHHMENNLTIKEDICDFEKVKQLKEKIQHLKIEFNQHRTNPEALFGIRSKLELFHSEIERINLKHDILQ